MEEIAVGFASDHTDGHWLDIGLELWVPTCTSVDQPIEICTLHNSTDVMHPIQTPG